MTGALRNIALAAILTCSCWGGVQCAAIEAVSDSVVISGHVANVVDTVLPETSVSLYIADFTLHPSDSVEVAVSRGERFVVWAEGEAGRLQFEVPLPRYADSVQFTLRCDSSGASWVVNRDTVLYAWAPRGTGCFPAASERDLMRMLYTAEKKPFESERFSIMKAWVQGQCLSPRQIRRCAAAFDDEERKLRLIQATTCTAPFELPALAAAFTSQHYREAFLNWTQETP